MSKSVWYDKYCIIDLNNKTSNCDDKYNRIEPTCKPVKDNVRTFYDNSGTPAASLDNQIMAATRNPNIDYNYFRAGK